MVQTKCRYFNGYKPCGRSEECSSHCTQMEVIGNSVLIVHLGALGAVVRSTALLELIRGQFPNAHLTWVTEKPADQLLKSHPLIDRVLTTRAEDLLKLSALEFNAAFVIDKSLKAAGVLKQTKAEKVFGFRADPLSGAIVPANSAAVELWKIGLDDQKKFFENQKSEVQLMCEALELNPKNSVPDYNLPLGPLELQLRDKRREQWRFNGDQLVIGINTGCGSVLPAKKLSVEFQRQMINRLMWMGFDNLVLLGGPEDTDRNHEIAAGLPVLQSPTEQGLRDGLVSVAACDLVITGDSLGLHMAISQKKYVVAWFGPTCSQEIELYGRGVKIMTKASCSPCWKRSCGQAQMCYDLVSLDEILQAVQKGHQDWQQQNEFSLSKPLF